MGEIILIRHGQANSAASDEETYDRLSQLGHQQVEAVGAQIQGGHGGGGGWGLAGHGAFLSGTGGPG